MRITVMADLCCVRCGKPALGRSQDLVSGRISPVCDACRRSGSQRILVLLLALVGVAISLC